MSRAAPLGLAVLLLPTTALAEGVDTFGSYGRGGGQRNLESPQDTAVELRFGRYVPDADDGLTGTPYEDTFGDKNRYYGGVEYDWQVVRIPYFGTVGPGFGVGFTQASAKAPLSSGEGRSGQDTSLSIIPMYVVGVVRVDVIPRESPIPLVPFGKLGVGYALWWSRDAGDTARVEGVPARGSSMGYHAAIGLAFQLDILDLEEARTADSNLGLNHSYAFGEWFVSKLGSGDQLEVGTSSWVLGLAFEF